MPARAGKRLACLKGHESRVLCLAMSPDGRFLVSSSSDPPIRLWDVANRRHLADLAGHHRVVLDLAFSPDGKLLATTSMDTTVMLWSVAEFSELTSDR